MGHGFSFPDFLDGFGAGIYLLFFIMQIDLWLRRRDRKAHLFLAIASSGALIVDLTGTIIRRTEGGVSVFVAFLNLLGAAVTILSILELIGILAQYPTKRIERITEACVIPLCILTPYFPSLFMLFAFLLIGLLLSGMVKALLASRKGNRESGLIAKGFLILILCLISDILKELKLLTLPYGLPIFGFLIMFLTSAHAINERFAEVEVASRTDPLTGMKNRRGFLEAGDWAVIRARRSRIPLCVLLCDVDFFKKVNDKLGHNVGDFLLKEIASLLHRRVRGQDIVARWGGDEFILLLPDTDLDGAYYLAESIRSSVARMSFNYEGAIFSVTISIGIAEHKIGTNLEDTIALADLALYRAKEEGRNRVVC